MFYLGDTLLVGVMGGGPISIGLSIDEIQVDRDSKYWWYVDVTCHQCGSKVGRRFKTGAIQCSKCHKVLREAD